MRHFIIEVNYTAPLEVIDSILAEHREFLQIGYDRGWLLFSGPRVPRIGGLVVARAPELEDLKRFFQDDPYVIKGVAEYNFIEFQPVKFQPWTADWLK